MISNHITSSRSVTGNCTSVTQFRHRQIVILPPMIKYTGHFIKMNNQNRELTDKDERAAKKLKLILSKCNLKGDRQWSYSRNSQRRNVGTAAGIQSLWTQSQRNLVRPTDQINEEIGCDENYHVPGEVMLTKNFILKEHSEIFS